MLTEQKLAIILSTLEEHPNPKYFLEQYSITPGIAANILFLAKDDIKNKIVYDLGCGTGRFAIGAALLGAKEVYGVDVDEDALDMAKKNVEYVEGESGQFIRKICNWVQSDVKNLKAEADTVIQFPPFTMDEIFFEKALQIAKNVYSIHEASVGKLEILKEICKKFKARIVKMRRFRYKIAWKEKREIGYDILLAIAKK